MAKDKAEKKKKSSKKVADEAEAAAAVAETELVKKKKSSRSASEERRDKDDKERKKGKSKAEEGSSSSREQPSSHSERSKESSKDSKSSSKEKEGRSSSKERESRSSSKERDSSKESRSSSKEKKSSSKSKSSGSSKHVDGHQAHLIYALVARGKTILADYTAFKGNFASVATECMSHLPANDSRVRVPHGQHTLDFLLDGTFTYMVLCDVDLPKDMAFAFLERVKDDFSHRFGKKGAKAAAGTLQKEYGPKLREHMQYVVDHPEEVNKFAKIKSQVAEVKGVMKQNIDKALQRGEKLENLQVKTDLLKDQAAMFQKQGEQIKDKMWWQNMKIKLIIFGGFGLLGVGIFFSVFGNPF